MDQLEGQLPGSSIYHEHDGYFYLRYQTSNNTQYFRCKYWRQGCPSLAKISSIDDAFYLTSGHSHAPDINQAEVMRERHVLLHQARNLNFRLIQDSFHNVNDPQLEQLHRQPLYRAVTRARNQTLPNVQNLAELRTLLEHPSFSWLAAYRDHLEHTGYRGSLQAPDGSQVLLFISNKCEHFLLTVTSIFIVQTSIIINNQEYKLITVATFWDRNEISLAWLLFESSNPDTFSAGFTLLRTNSPTHQFSDAFCRRDEVANAFRCVYPMVKTRPSFFDYINEIKSNLQLTECMGILLQNPAGLKIIKLCCASLLLPKDLMQTGLNQIAAEALNSGEEVYSQAVHLFNFIEREWLSCDNLEVNLCGSFEGTHYGIIYLGLKLERHLTRANDLYFVTNYIISSMTKAHKKIVTAVNGSHSRNSVPVPIAAELQFWNLLRAAGFPQDLKVSNILDYVSNKIVF